MQRSSTSRRTHRKLPTYRWPLQPLSLLVLQGQACPEYPIWGAPLLAAFARSGALDRATLKGVDFDLQARTNRRTLFSRPFYASEAASLPCRMMVITQHPRHLPSPILVLPEMHKLPFPVPNLRMPGMMKSVHSHFDRAISFHVVNLQAACDQFARCRRANVLLNRLDQRRPAQRDASLI